jgi:hypothetical protein
MVDLQSGPGSALTGAWLASAAELGSSPRVGEKGEQLRGVLTEGFGGRFDGEARPAAVKLSGGQLGARRVGNGGRDECGEERLDREGDRAAGGGGINAGRSVRWRGETEG